MLSQQYELDKCSADQRLYDEAPAKLQILEIIITNYTLYNCSRNTP